MTATAGHSLAFRQALVDEALHRTPKGGFPELEERHQLAPGTLFDWVKELGPAPPPAPFSALHFWLGNTPLDEAAFYNYFAGKKCGFCKDLHTRYRYDEDLLLIIYLPKPVPVEEIVGHSTLESDESLAQIVQACSMRGIHQANAMFVYADPTQSIPEPGKLYNGLPYIGLFDD